MHPESNSPTTTANVFQGFSVTFVDFSFMPPTVTKETT